MIDNEITRALADMREVQITMRRTAIAKRDILGLREAQAGLQAIASALEDERALAQKAATDEELRRAREKPARHTSEYDPFADPDEPSDFNTL